MAKIMVNAALQRIAILEKEGYVSRAIVYSKISGDEVLEFASMNSGINQGQLSAAMHAVVQEFRNHLLTGHSVELPGVGIFRVGVNSKMVEAPEDVSVSNITRRKIYFLPSTNIKALLSRVSFTTTGDSEDEEDNGSNGSSGGGSGTPETVAAPVIRRHRLPVPFHPHLRAQRCQCFRQEPRPVVDGHDHAERGNRHRLTLPGRQNGVRACWSSGR